MNATARVDMLRIPPHDIGAEQAVLGALLIDSAALARISDWLRPADFYRHTHAALYGAISDMVTAGKPVDPFTLVPFLRDAGISADDVPDVYVFELQSTTGSAANVVAYAEIVLERSRLRQVIDAGTRMVNGAFEQRSASADIVATTLHSLADIATEHRAGLEPLKRAAKSWFHDFTDRYQGKRKFDGRMTPYDALNDLTLGLKPADLIIVGARPGMGKTVIGFGLAAYDALQGGRPAVFSLEMSAEQFIEREVAALGKIPHDWLRRGGLPELDQNGDPIRMGEVASNEQDQYWDRVSGAVSALVGSDLLIDDQSGLNIRQIMARAKRAHLQKPLTMVVIDHIHIVETTGDRNESTATKIGHISRGLKGLAKELRVPVIGLAQLNRGNTQRADKRPTMADLRESGAIEQDADYILLIHRDDYYDGDSDSDGLVELIVGKARHTRQRTIALRNRLDEMRFDNWDGPIPSRESKPKGSSGADKASRGFD